jgi:type VI protein secretion system component VasK
MLTAMAGVWLVLVILGAVLVFVFWGMIFSRAGYSFAMALLMFIPLVNFIWLLIFAFSRWPVQRELDHYRRMGPPPQAYPPRY